MLTCITLRSDFVKTLPLDWWDGLMLTFKVCQCKGARQWGCGRLLESSCVCYKLLGVIACNLLSVLA
jgi:hypothetical protein